MSLTGISGELFGKDSNTVTGWLPLTEPSAMKELARVGPQGEASVVHQAKAVGGVLNSHKMVPVDCVVGGLNKCIGVTGRLCLQSSP